MKTPMNPNRFGNRMILLVTAIHFLALAGRAAEGGTWVKKADMPTPRIGLSTCEVNGKVYAIGGYREAGASGMKTVEAYDPVADSWTRKTDMPTARLMSACAAVNGKIYIIGGDLNFVSSPMNIVEEYDPTTDTWTRKANLPTARSGPAAAAVDGKIYVIGGLTTFGASPLSTVEVYDPVTDTWARKAAMPTGRGLLLASAVDGKIYTIGSSSPPSGPWLPTVEMYDPLTDTWSRKPDMPTARGASAGGAVQGRIYVMGGRNAATSLATVEEYNPLSGTWIERASMWAANPATPSRRWNFSGSEVNGRIYAIGGAFEIGGAHAGVSLVLEYTPPDINIGPPVIYSQPWNRTELPGGSVTFAVAATGGQPILYQWLLNDLPVNNGTNSTLTLSNLTLNHSGSYRVLVSNSVGSVTSQSAALSVVPVAVISQTGNTNVWPGSNVTFQVAIRSTVPTSCQWRLNGTDIFGATDLVLGLTNIQMTHNGEYTAVLNNSFGSITSAVTRLSVLVRPEIVQPPLSQSVVAGGNVTLSVGIRGNPAPFGFQWRRSSTILTNIVLSERTCFLTLTKVQTNQGGTYRVVITNSASPTLTVNATFNLTVLPDSDGDGLPDDWESAHGLDANDSLDALLDADGDGCINLEEYIAGTDPDNILSALRIDSVAVSNGTSDVALWFQAVLNKTYTVQSRGTVDSGIWSRVADIIATPTNRMVEISDPVAGPPNEQKFYRVVTPQWP